MYQNSFVLLSCSSQHVFNLSCTDLNLTFSHKATWTALASEEMIEITWNVVEEPAVWVSKNETSCLRTELRYFILILEVCLSAVLAQHNPSAEAVVTETNQFKF